MSKTFKISNIEYIFGISMIGSETRGMWQMFKGVIKSWKKLGRFPSHSFITFAFATPSCLYRVLCSTWYLRRYITICFPQTYVATYSCLITFGSLAMWRRKFGAWLEPAMRDSRWSTVGKGTPSRNLHRSTMDSNMVLYGSAAWWKGLGASPDRYLESGE